MKFQLLPSTFNHDGSASVRQHLACFVIDDKVAIDAGSLAMAATDAQRDQIRDVVLTHAHLDHIAGLPLYVDDLFSSTREPVRIYATREVVDVLERDIFNWSVYPKFSELANGHGPVMEYRDIEPGVEFGAGHLTLKAIPVNHKVPSFGFVISDGASTIALTGDTAETSDFWDTINKIAGLKAVLIECAFPNEFEELARTSHHLTPSRLADELRKCKIEVPVFVINIKPVYREQVLEQLGKIGRPGLQVLEPGRVYDW